MISKNTKPFLHLMHINNEPPTANRTELHVFDVDGTLTRHDSLLLLVRFVQPAFYQQAGLWLSLLPIGCKAFLKGHAGLLKEALLYKLWKGLPKDEITKMTEAFFRQLLLNDVRKKASSYINRLREKDSNVKLVLLSASCREWLQPLANHLQADLICTELAYDRQQQFTGQFATPNCKGAEKVKRLLECYPANKYDFICYGNTASDKHLQSISKQFFYRYF